MNIKTIDWSRAEHINAGGWGVIYRVAPLVVAKVAPVLGDEEFAAQLYFAAKNKALPVLGYMHNLMLPDRIRRECCSVHGVRPIAPDTCTCNTWVDVMLMPEADVNIGHLPQEEIDAFMDEIERACGDELERTWDRRESNVARYQGHFVALDFGDPEGPWC